MNTFALSTNEDVNGRILKAQQVDQQIRVHIRMIQESACHLGQSLATMKEEELYLELGYQEFGEYTQEAHGFKERQAYTYIKVAKEFPKHLLQSTADLGVTKLELLLNIPDLDKEEFIQSHNLGEMTVEELRQLVEEHTHQGEQLNLLEGEKEEILSEKEDLLQKVEELEHQLKEERQKQTETPPPSSVEDLETIQKETREEVEKELKEKHQKDLVQVLKKQEEAILQQEKERYESIIQTAQQEKEEAQRKAESQERELLRLRKEGKEDIVVFGAYFDTFQENFSKMLQHIERTKDTHPEQAETMRGALQAGLTKLLDTVQE